MDAGDRGDDDHDAEGGASSRRDAGERDDGAADDGAADDGAADDGAADDGAADDGAADDDATDDGAADDGAADDGAGDRHEPGAQVFAQDRVWRIALEIDPADYEHLEERGNDEEYRPSAARLRADDVAEVSFAELGVRHKGNWSLHHCWDDNGGVRNHAAECAKLSFKLKFDEYDDSGRFDGLKRLNLHAAAGDASKLRELLAYGTFRDFGIDAPRTALAELSINGEPRGVFIVVEEIDGRYTAAHFDGGDGNLYKEVWPRAGLSDAHYLAALETNEELADVSDMQSFARAVADSNVDTLRQDLAGWVDIDHLLRYIAVDRGLENWDGIMAFYEVEKPHNFFWYHRDDAQGLFQLIPWDLDNTFWPFDPYMDPEQWVTAPPIPDWNETPRDCEPRPVWEADSVVTVVPPRCDPLLDRLARAEWPRFEELAAELIAGPLSYEQLSARARHHAALLRPLVEADPYLDVDAWSAGVDELEAILAEVALDLQTFVDRGLIDEGEESGGSGGTEGPTEDELLSSGAERGIVPGLVSNFEFVDLAHGAALDALSFYGDEASSVDAYWSTNDPIFGTADVRIEFTLVQNLAGAYDEWVNLLLATDGWAEYDVRGYQNLVMTLRTDVLRSVRVRVHSNAYDDTFGGAWSEFGQDFAVTSEPVTIALPLHDLVYPDWARAAWPEGAGWTGSDADALEALLQRFGGVLFVPQATVDEFGELVSEVEPGFLQVDNVYFE